jgi:hypothetical protein
MPHLFTPQASLALREQFPFESGNPEDNRIGLTLSRDDMWKIRRGPDWSAIVTDLPSSRVFHVRGAPCGLGCHCAAQVVRELTGVPVSEWPRMRGH